MGKKDELLFGGAGDGPGLTLDDGLSMGTSYKCLTFENEPLCGSSTSFYILKVEVYHFSV